MSKSQKTLTIEEVSHVAHLAKLGLTKEELEKFQSQLSQILGLVDAITKVDTTGVEPTSQVTGQENIFREDVIEESLPQEAVLSNAPRKFNGYFVVDAIFNE